MSSRVTTIALRSNTSPSRLESISVCFAFTLNSASTAIFFAEFSSACRISSSSFCSVAYSEVCVISNAILAFLRTFILLFTPLPSSASLGRKKPHSEHLRSPNHPPRTCQFSFPLYLGSPCRLLDLSSHCDYRWCFDYPTLSNQTSR